MSDEVEYRDVVGYEGYRVGSDGSVLSCWERRWFKGEGKTGSGSILTDRWHPLTPVVEKAYGYCIVTLRKGKKRYNRKVHILVLEAFKGPKPEGKLSAHENGVRTDNRVDNLNWKTPKENMEDRDRHGTTIRGQRSPNTHLTEEDVLNMHHLKKLGMAHRDIGSIFNAAKSTVTNILLGRSWGHIRP